MRRRSFLVAALLACLYAPSAQAAIAFDAFTALAGGVDPSGTHTPAGTPNAAIVAVFHPDTEPVVAVTYAGVDMGASVATLNNGVAGELATAAFTYFLLNSPTAGAQTVAVNGGAGAVAAYVVTVTASNTVSLVATQNIQQTTGANPSATLALGGVTSFVLMPWLSGQDDSITNVTPLTNWTSRSETDNGTQGGGAYTYDIIGSTDVTIGVTQTTDDFFTLSAAFREDAAASTTDCRNGPLTGLAGPCAD